MLSDSLKILLGSTYGFLFKAQNFHWNVEGPDFPQLHKMFDEIIEDVEGSIDKTAEYIRILNDYVPAGFMPFAKLSVIKDQTEILTSYEMVSELYEDNLKMIKVLNTIFEVADRENEQGIADFIAGRIDAHGKHKWFLRSVMKMPVVGPEETI
jgi:starvation-inducible DNA-binding protein